MQAHIYHLNDPPGEYGSQEFIDICYRKLEILRIELRDSESILYTDVDVVFRRDPRADLDQHLCDFDAVFQREEPGGLRQQGPHLWCAGFYAMRPTDATKRLVRPREHGERNRWPRLTDQGLIGTRLLTAPSIARVDLLPPELYPSGWYQLHSTLRADRFICHYNWSVTLESKIARMKAEGDWFL